MPKAIKINTHKLTKNKTTSNKIDQPLAKASVNLKPKFADAFRLLTLGFIVFETTAFFLIFFRTHTTLCPSALHFKKKKLTVFITTRL